MFKEKAEYVTVIYLDISFSVIISVSFSKRNFKIMQHKVLVVYSK